MKKKSTQKVRLRGVLRRSEYHFTKPVSQSFNPIRPGLFLGAWALGLGGGEGEVGALAAHNSKIIHCIEIKFRRVVENRELVNLI